MTPKKETMLKVFLEAIDRPGGIEIMLPSKHDAQKFRFYLYKLRQKLRAAGHPRLEEIELLDIKLKGYPEQSGQCAIVVKTSARLFNELRVVDIDSGESISEKFDVVDEMVQIDEREFGK